MAAGLRGNLISSRRSPNSPLDMSSPGKQSCAPGEALPGLQREVYFPSPGPGEQGGDGGVGTEVRGLGWMARHSSEGWDCTPPALTAASLHRTLL